MMSAFYDWSLPLPPLCVCVFFFSCQIRSNLPLPDAGKYSPTKKQRLLENSSSQRRTVLLFWSNDVINLLNEHPQNHLTVLYCSKVESSLCSWRINRLFTMFPQYTSGLLIHVFFWQPRSPSITSCLSLSYLLCILLPACLKTRNSGVLCIFSIFLVDFLVNHLEPLWLPLCGSL